MPCVCTRCVTWPVWPVNTRAITGQHGSAAQTGQHGPGRVSRTAPAHSATVLAQRHTMHTHTCTQRLSWLIYYATLCAAALAVLQLSILKIDYDETTVLIIDPCHACAFRAADLRFKTLSSTHTDKILINEKE